MNRTLCADIENHIQMINGLNKDIEQLKTNECQLNFEINGLIEMNQKMHADIENHVQVENCLNKDIEQLKSQDVQLNEEIDKLKRQTDISKLTFKIRLMQ